MRGKTHPIASLEAGILSKMKYFFILKTNKYKEEIFLIE